MSGTVETGGRYGTAAADEIGDRFTSGDLPVAV
jgi:hypothetical protein